MQTTYESSPLWLRYSSVKAGRPPSRVQVLLPCNRICLSRLSLLTCAESPRYAVTAASASGFHFGPETTALAIRSRFSYLRVSTQALVLMHAYGGYQEGRSD